LKCFSANADSSKVETGEVAMKIVGSGLVETQLPVGSVAARALGSDSTGTTGATGDWTSFHSDSASVQSLTSQALTFPEIRQGTVDALRLSVESGEYPVDVERIAPAISNSQGVLMKVTYEHTPDRPVTFSPKAFAMNDQAVRDQLAVIYLQHLQALALEISATMNAIAGNDLTRFRDTVAQQEMLCAVLATMGRTIRTKLESSDAALPAFSDPTVEENIRVAIGTIRQLNPQYGALLKHSGRSIALLASLCRSCTGQVLEMNGTRLKRETWSFEM
jgi:anti-sigma28 factor (negative regulator of flagellin synthesis)